MPDSTPLNIAIIGGGKKGLAILESFLEVVDVRIVGIADKDPSAPGLRRAAQANISHGIDLLSLITREEVDLILDATRDPEVPELVMKNKRSRAEYFCGASAELFWKFVQSMIAQNRQVRSLIEQVKTEAMRDPLTGLYNRRYFNYRMEEEMIRADRNRFSLAFLLCDLDHFKSINDTLGHVIGDQVLKAVAKSIQESIRGVDLVFRWGGDEMVVVFPETAQEKVALVADRIRKGVQRVGREANIPLDLSIGVSIYPDHGLSIDELLSLADRSLAIAKRGGDKVQIGEKEYDLDESSIKVVFQPVVDVRSNQVLGYEALSRDPQEKLTLPELFKKFQVLGHLSELKQLCFDMQLREAQKMGLQKVFINVDSVTSDVLGRLQMLSKTEEREIILEISEAEAMHDIENNLRMAQKWREQGYKFAIDDFGAGFISLPFIAQFIPDYVKMDRSTILLAVTSKKFATFLRDLIHALRNYVTIGFIAEGIETEEEFRVAKEMGIHLMQGYLFGRPEPLTNPNALPVSRRIQASMPI